LFIISKTVLLIKIKMGEKITKIERKRIKKNKKKKVKINK
jgi:hypothetical protein